MFCYQCEQTARGTGCTEIGVCGKSPDAAGLQDLLLDVAKSLALRLSALTPEQRPATQVEMIEAALFATVTNVNFDTARLETLIRELAGAAGRELPADSAGLTVLTDLVGISARRSLDGDDVVGLQELLTYGLKGMAAYAHHARRLGRVSAAVDEFTIEALAALARNESDIGRLLDLTLRCGEASVAVLALLDSANTGSFGPQTPGAVRMGHVPGKAILVSGHDLGDLKALLEQTEGTGINIYTHGEMLPAHAYPELRRHAHLAGHFGGAWMWQRREFDTFPGAILMTTNCIQRPADSYADRLFTCGPVAWPGISHVVGQDFSAVIAAAQKAPGFSDSASTGVHQVGFGHHAVLGLADTVVDAIKSGAVKHFAVIGGCDGTDTARSYYTDLAAGLPQDWIIMTLGCGKFRLIGHDYGQIGPLPRLLDMGQCNDAFSAIKVAQALAGVFGCGLNDLPLSLVLSWYEQKAVCVLLALLHLGVRNIRIGPSLPAFVTPAVLQVLVDKFNVMPVGGVTDDLKALTAA